MYPIRSLLMLSTVLVCLFGKAQELDGVVYRGVIENGDTMMQAILPPVRVDDVWIPKNRREEVKYDKLMRNVLKVYPYAEVTGKLMNEYAFDMAQISSEGDQKLYIKLAEIELRAEFEEELKDLTMSQGRVLLKLIDRETGETSYDLVKELRGDIHAFIWQGLAKLFGQDLKSTYDMEGEDRFIEHIVQRIERGELAVTERGPRTAKAQARLVRRKARLYRKHELHPEDSSMN